MLILDDFEPKDIAIKGNRGGWYFGVHVVEILTDGNPARIKKLIGLIAGSTDPQQVEILKRYLTEWSQKYEPVQKDLAEMCVSWRTMAQRAREDKNKDKLTRNRFKKGTPEWEAWNGKMKLHDSISKDAERMARKHEIEFKANERLNDKFDKVWNYMGGKNDN